MGLTDDLGNGRVGLDTSVFIYLIEEERRYLPVVEPLFAQAERAPANSSPLRLPCSSSR